MTSAQLDLDVVVSGDVPDETARYARDKVAAVLANASEPVLFARVRLTVVGNPSLGRPAVAQVNLDYNGRPVRVQTSGPTLHEVVDRLEARLRSRLERMPRHWEAIRGARPETAEHEWRHISRPTERPSYFPRPMAERQLVRRKALTLTRLTPDEAALDMDALDHDFYLFIEAQTGEPCVLSRQAQGYRLARLRRHQTLPRTVIPLTVVPHAATRLTLDEAMERLELSDEPFLFYRDVDANLAHVLYRRYDGHYGLISPQ